MNDSKENTTEFLGQLMMPRLEIYKFGEDESYRNFITGLIEKKYVGGFCIFGGTVESLPIILGELQSLAKKSGLPTLLMSCDCEWGLPMRLNKGGTEFPHLMALERMGDQNGIKQVAQAIGIEMSALGLHWNFAPVADINSNPKNPIINIRAFSGEPKIVAECANSFYDGLESAGIIATAKHFPGHGDTETDSHSDLPYIDKSFEEFNAAELVPFTFLSNKGIPSIMTGHIAAPKLADKFGASEAGRNLPATISPFLTKKLLREHIGFTGVIITDSLEMLGLQKVISNVGEIASRAFIAGADILLMPTDPIAAYNGLSKSLDSGGISSDEISQSIKRIQNLREKYADTATPKVKVKWLEHGEMAKLSAENALHIEGIIRKPFSPSSVLIISRGMDSEKKQVDLIKNFFAAEFPNTNIFDLHERDQNEWDDKPLIIILHRPRGILTGDTTTRPIHTITNEIIGMLQRKKITPLGMIAFGDPNVADEFSDMKPEFTMKTYSDSIPSLEAGLHLLKKNK